MSISSREKRGLPNRNKLRFILLGILSVCLVVLLSTVEAAAGALITSLILANVAVVPANLVSRFGERYPKKLPFGEIYGRWLLLIGVPLPIIMFAVSFLLHAAGISSEPLQTLSAPSQLMRFSPGIAILVGTLSLFMILTIAMNSRVSWHQEQLRGDLEHSNKLHRTKNRTINELERTCRRQRKTLLDVEDILRSGTEDAIDRALDRIHQSPVMRQKGNTKE